MRALSLVAVWKVLVSLFISLRSEQVHLLSQHCFVCKGNWDYVEGGEGEGPLEPKGIFFY